MTTELAERPRRELDLRDLIQTDGVIEQLAYALPKYFEADQFAVIVRTAINRNPKLMECTRESFMVAVLTAAQMGIAPDNRRGYLIPRFNSKTGKMDCNFQPSYIGLIELIRRDQNVSDLYAVVVCEGDKFELRQGLHRDLIHEPDPFASGKLMGVYAVINYKNGCDPAFVWMNRKDVETVRDHSDSWRAHVAKGYSTPWKDDEAEMWKKTAIHRIAKTANLSGDTAERVTRDIEAQVLERTPKIERAVIADRPAQSALPEPETTQEAVAEAQPATSEAGEPAAPKRTTRRKLLVTKPEPDQAAATPPESTAPAPDPAPVAPAAAVSQPATPAADPGPDDAPAPKVLSEKELLAKELLAKLQEDGFSGTEAECVRLAIAQGWCEPCNPIATPIHKALNADMLRGFLGDIETVKSEITVARNAMAAQP